jgi:hypothetical protein
LQKTRHQFALSHLMGLLGGALSGSYWDVPNSAKGAEYLETSHDDLRFVSETIREY